MKKLLALFLSVCTVLTLFSVCNFTALANNPYETAIEIEPGYSVSGYANAGDVYYKIIAPAKGKLSLKFEHDWAESSEYDTWELHIYKGDPNGGYSEYSHQRIYTDSGSMSLPYIGCNKGDAFYIKISIRELYGTVKNLEYTLTVDFENTNYYETEFNNSYNTATNLKINAKTSANCYNDDDYFKLLVPTSCNINISFSHDWAECCEYDTWEVNIYKENVNGGYIDDSYTRVYTSSSTVDLKISNAKKGDIYYIKVKTRTLHNTVKYLEYAIKPVLEIQKPDKPAISTSGKTAKISWSKSSKVTGYQVQISKKSNFKSTVVNKSILGEKKNKYSKKLSYNTRYYARVRSYVKVGSTYYYSKWSKSTSFMMIKTPAKPTVTAKKSGAKIKWKKNSSASGYQVQISKRSSFSSKVVNKKISGAKKTSYSKSLSSKTKYYVRVRSYIKKGSKYYYSKWSNKRSFRTK